MAAVAAALRERDEARRYLQCLLDDSALYLARDALAAIRASIAGAQSTIVVAAALLKAGNLVSSTAEGRKYELRTAADVLRRAVACFAEAVGGAHHATLKARRHYVEALVSAGDTKEARVQLDCIVDICEKAPESASAEMRTWATALQANVDNKPTVAAAAQRSRLQQLRDETAALRATPTGTLGVHAEGGAAPALREASVGPYAAAAAKLAISNYQNDDHDEDTAYCSDTQPLRA
ncbi:hypothetical protein M885DRAFT_561757 [Pelagophyceae sp. CCMP2097]|nr:hypothetical protein M885DRAFT_561757 [Pelagophyceae sp. CCMP2097]